MASLQKKISLMILLKNTNITEGRKLRNWFPGATYHLMERGIRRLAIFQDEMDFEMFLEILKKSETAEQERL